MNHLVEFCLMHQKEIEQAVNDKREDSNTPKTGGGGSGHSFVSDPTCHKAIKRLMPVGPVYVPYGPKLYGKRGHKLIYNPEEWLQAIADTWKHYDSTRSFDVMCMRYNKGMNYKMIADELKISYQRVYVVLADIHKTCLNFAKKHKAVKTQHNPRTIAILNKIKKERMEKDEEVIETL